MTEINKIKLASKIIILSAGQLAQLALESATKREMEVVLLADKEGSPAGKLINPVTGVPFVMPKNNIITLNWTDKKALNKLAETAGNTDVPVTTEWENIPAEAAEYLEKLGFTVYPNSQILRTIQDRYTEKEAIRSRGVDTVPFGIVTSCKDIENFISEHGGFNSGYILKTRKGGYDGHGQARIKTKDDIENAFGKLKNVEGGLIIEKMIDLESEISVIVARDRYGNIGNLEPILNIHLGGILRTSITKAPISPDLQARLVESARNLISNWSEYVGILTVEFFIDKNGKIYVNEIAPRTHNSGHATLDNGGTSQNDLWMDAISGRVIDIVNGTRQVIMHNLLSPQDLRKCMELLKEYPDRMRLYNYLKLSDDEIKSLNWSDDKSRKVGHVNLIGE